jgi:hypothetical protein
MPACTRSSAGATPARRLLDFLSAPWPRYYTGFDLAANILAYVPLGFLLVPALQGRLGHRRGGARSPCWPAPG